MRRLLRFSRVGMTTLSSSASALGHQLPIPGRKGRSAALVLPATLLGLAVLFLMALTIPAYADEGPSAPIPYAANLSGPAESPPNASPGTGSASVEFDLTAHTMRVQVSFSGLLSTTTAAHIHACTVTPGTGTAGVATQVPSFVGFPLGVTSGAYDHTFDTSLASTYNPAYVTANGGSVAAAETALAACMAVGGAYLNIHTAVFPGGEIRGFLTPVPSAVAVRTLKATRSGSDVILRWSVGSEVGVLGYRIDRARGNGWTAVHDRLVVASGSVAPTKRYVLRDRGARCRGTCVYRLVVVGADGSRRSVATARA